MINKEILSICIIVVGTTFCVAQNQKPEYRNNFESYEEGTILTEPGVKKRLFTWGDKTKFSSVNKEGKGNKGVMGTEAVQMKVFIVSNTLHSKQEQLTNGKLPLKLKEMFPVLKENIL